jgi:hypothetical protein
MARLIGETEKIVDAAQIPAAEFSSQVRRWLYGR